MNLQNIDPVARDITPFQHFYSEIPKRDKIKLSYQEALKVLSSMFRSNEVLALSFENYKKLKDRTFETIPVGEKVLINIFLDKFEGMLHFIQIEDAETLSHSTFNFETGDLSPSQKLKYSCVDQQGFVKYMVQNLNSKISTIHYLYPNERRLEDGCSISRLFHYIVNGGANIPDCFDTQRYTKDEDYPIIHKIYRPLNNEQGAQEVNFTLNSQKHSTYNPAHTLINPKHIENYEGKLLKRTS